METLQEIYFTERAKLYAGLCYQVQQNNTYEFIIFSNDFSGKATFCLLLKDAREAANKLKEMSTTLRGECTITDTESNDFLTVSFKKSQVYVSGMFGDFGEHSLRFGFNADQTILMRLAQALD